MWIFLTLATVRQAVARGNRGLQFLNLMMMKRMVNDDEDEGNKEDGYDDDESSGLPQMVMRDVDIFLDSQEQFHPR